MRVLKLLYKDGKTLEQFIHENQLENEYTWLVRIHASTPDKNICKDIANKVKGLLPEATVIGCTVSGVIFDAQIYDEETLILFTGFERASVVSDFFSIEGMTDLEIATHIEKDVSEISPALAIIHIGGITPYSEGIIRRLSKSLPNTPFVGGIAACQDGQGNINSVVFDENEVYENTISVTYITDDFVLAYTNAIVGHAPISEPYTITAMTGDYIDEIEGKPSVEWINEQLGIAQLHENVDYEATVSTDILLRFPFVIEGEDGSSRFVQYDATENKLRQYYSQVEVGTEFRIGYVSPVKSVEEWQNLCYDLQNTPVETMFCYSCLFRKLFLNNLSKWEMAPFIDQDVCGAFMFGEISTKNDNTYYYNGTCAVFTMAEKVNYITPNLSAYDRIDELDDTNSEMVETLQNVVNLAKDKKEVALFANALRSEELAMDRMQLSDDTMGRFLKDRGQGENQRICLVSIEDTSLRDFGDSDRYLMQLMKDMKDYVDTNFTELKIKFYRFGKRNFFFTTSNTVATKLFIDAVKEVYGHFAKNTEVATVFAVTTRGKNPQELWDYIVEHSNQEIVEVLYCDDYEENHDLQKEFEIVEQIKAALENDGVIPYFQGIYDSQRSNFFAYEALMRIQALDGEILPPSVFMEVAKKHELYLELSYQMVNKVLSLFANRSEVITMNISSLDIHSEKFADMITNHLEKMEDSSHFIFELVETEKFAGQEHLRQFIRKLKQNGAKIAIDDFGSGYSNFIEIGNLEIDYIKINGSLTELLGTDVSYNQILDSIFYLSKKMQVDLIAECVETAAMQKTLVKSGIRYSQGYLFSRPMPLEEFYVVAEENEALSSVKSENKDESEQFTGDVTRKVKKRSLLGGGIATVILLMAAILLFSANNLKTVEELSDEFLVEMATGMADKVSSKVKDASDLLQSTEIAVTSHYPDTVEMSQVLGELTNVNSFDDMYIAINGEAPVDSNGNRLITDVELSLDGTKNGEVRILPPMTDEETGRKLFVIGTPFDAGEGIEAALYGVFYVDEFSSVLDLKNFGGEAFYHLCQVDGTPIVLSGSSDNLFMDGDMYTFIESLDITNGHTAQSLRKDMENGETAVLKYEVSGESRTAVMVRVPDTQWCVVSILLSDVTTQMTQEIDTSTYAFAIAVILIFGGYLAFTFAINTKNEKSLKKALESSYYLANSLQATMETDSLTKTYSRATAQEKITEAIHRIEKETNEDVHTLMLVDVDNFKKINDIYGHQAGDQYLLELVSALKCSLRTGDILGRLGGDEFVILLSDVGSKENASVVIERIISNVNGIAIKNVDLDEVGVSIGAVMIPEYATEYMTLNNMADKALYKAKDAGKNTYAFYDNKTQY